jgi:hypothetical protein
MSREQKQFVDHRARLFVLAGRVRYAVATGGEANWSFVRPSPPLARQPEYYGATRASDERKIFQPSG